MFITRRQLDEVLSASAGRPTKLFRLLLSVFFQPSVLATSSALGSKKNNALDKEILEACIRKCVSYLYTVEPRLSGHFCAGSLPDKRKVRIIEALNINWSTPVQNR